jgi:hypothetical protein
MSDCGCTSQSSSSIVAPYSFTNTLRSVLGEQSNADGRAFWGSDSAGDSPAVSDISGRSPYGEVPSFGGVSFCRKCLLTWLGVFLIIALVFFNRK